MSTAADLKWELLKKATLSTPAVIAANLCIEIVKFQESIAHKEDGAPPSLQEMNLICKLINCLDKLKKYLSLPMTIQAINGFMHFVREQSPKLAASLDAQLQNYLSREGNKAFKPHDLEYDVDLSAGENTPGVASTPSPAERSEKKVNEPPVGATASPPTVTVAKPQSRVVKPFSHSGLNKQAASFASRSANLAATG